MKLRLVALFATLTLFAYGPGCSKHEPDDASDGGDTDSQSDDDTGSDTVDTETDESWDGVKLDSVIAPDEYSVVVVFDGTPPASDLGMASTYTIGSDVGALTIEGVEYEPSTSTLVLTTEKQKLGTTYTLTVSAAEAPEELSQEFPSADTAQFWVVDFASAGYSQFILTANREVIGEHNVVYIEEGWYSMGADAASAKFDAEVFPVETAMFTDAPDIDGNGKITILGLNGQGYYGGYFSPVNAYPESYTWSSWGLHSNEMEIIHINVAGGGSFDEGEGIVPHEFQHLLYQEDHPMSDWTYHNEGLAESAVRLVNGEYPTAVGYYFADYYGMIGDGDVSLVNWTYAQYENYVTAFLFFAYIAGQLDGVDTYGDLFDLPSGEPSEIDAFLQAELGISFGQAQLNQMVANWVQADSGEYGYEGFVDMGGQVPPRVSNGTESVTLQPFAGTYFPMTVDSVDYPGTQGEHIVYAGINSSGLVDMVAPFDVSGGGALVVLNANFQYDTFPSEDSGPDIPAGSGSKAGYSTFDMTDSIHDVFESGVPPAWFDPPPYNPLDPEPFHRWQAATAARLASKVL